MELKFLRYALNLGEMYEYGLDLFYDPSSRLEFPTRIIRVRLIRVFCNIRGSIIFSNNRNNRVDYFAVFQTFLHEIFVKLHLFSVKWARFSWISFQNFAILASILIDWDFNSNIRLEFEVIVRHSIFTLRTVLTII